VVIEHLPRWSIVKVPIRFSLDIVVVDDISNFPWKAVDRRLWLRLVIAYGVREVGLSLESGLSCMLRTVSISLGNRLVQMAVHEAKRSAAVVAYI
jgi:hypothetical protein